MAGAGSRTRKDGSPSAKVGSIERLRPKMLGPGMPSMREVRQLGAAADAGPKRGKLADELAARAASARAARTAFMAARRGEAERRHAGAAKPAAAIAHEVGGQRTAAGWAAEMSRLRDKQPRPLHKLYGRNPTPEQITAHKEATRAYEKEYRHASKMQKETLARENEARAGTAKPAPKPEAPAAGKAGPTPLQAQHIHDLSTYHHDRSTREHFSAADRTDGVAHGMIAQVYREAAKGGDVEAHLAAADKEWRAFAAERNKQVDNAPKTKMGPYSGASSIHYMWANPDKVKDMSDDVRRNVAREMGKQHTPEAEARHAAWKAGEERKWKAIAAATDADHAAAVGKTPAYMRAAAESHAEAAAALRSAPARHAVDHPQHKAEIASREDAAKWHEIRASKLEGEAKTFEQAGKQKAAAVIAKKARAEKLRADMKVQRESEARAEAALKGGPKLNEGIGKTIQLNTRDGSTLHVPVLAHQGDFALHYATNADGTLRSGGAGKSKDFVITHAPTGMNTGFARDVKSQAEGKAYLAALGHPDFKRAFDAWAAASPRDRGEKAAALRDAWYKVKPAAERKAQRHAA